MTRDEGKRAREREQEHLEKYSPYRYAPRTTVRNWKYRRRHQRSHAKPCRNSYARHIQCGELEVARRSTCRTAYMVTGSCKDHTDDLPWAFPVVMLRRRLSVENISILRCLFVLVVGISGLFLFVVRFCFRHVIFR